MNELRAIWNDVKTRDYLETYLILAVGLLVLLADVLGFPTETIMGEVVLATLAALLYLSIKERREYKKLSEEKEIHGITVFRPSRSGMEDLGEFLSKAQKDITLYAVKHSALVHQNLGLLSKKAKDGCRVKILIMEDKDSEGNENPNVQAVTDQRFQAGIMPVLEENTQLLRRWFNKLDPPVRENIEIRQYREFAPVTYTLIDREGSRGQIQVEVFIPKVDVADIPHYIVTRHEDEEFFENHCKSFDGIWNDASQLR